MATPRPTRVLIGWGLGVGMVCVGEGVRRRRRPPSGPLRMRNVPPLISLPSISHACVLHDVLSPTPANKLGRPLARGSAERSG